MTDYTYIIVGAGSAGCVLANRLSENPAHKVLLVEAGPSDNSFLVHMPKGFGKLLSDPKRAWFYQTEPEPATGDKPEFWARGKMLGGSSSINGMVYIRGNPGDFDQWAAQGARGWDWNSIAPCYRKIENHVLGGDESRGAGGAVGITVADTSDPLSRAFIDAGTAMGLPERKDINHPDQHGIGPLSRNIRNGRRQSAAEAFLKPVRGRTNLIVLTNTRVEKVLFDNGRAVGVECLCGSARKVFRTSGEIILSAGAIETPKLLQLSGIGDGEQLRALGVDVVVDNPSVGRNMREHRLLFMQFGLRQPISQNRDYSGWRLLKNTLRYFLFKKGVMAEGSYQAGGFAGTGVNPDDNRPDIQFFMAPYSLDFDSGKMNFESGHGMQVFAYVLRPTSQGEVSLRSANPADPPRIRANYHDTDYDRNTSIAMVRFMRELMAQPSMKPFVTNETVPGVQMQSDDEILAAFRRFGQSGYHAAGTCRMGSDDGAVVDEALKVKGVSGLRVMDLSILPTMISGNTNAPMMAMAWRAADLIVGDSAS